MAVKNYRCFLNDIRKDVPLDKLTDEDVKEFLSDWDYDQYEHGVKGLQEWLSKCSLDNSESTLSVYPNSFPTWGTWGFKALLVKVYQRKQQQLMLLAAQKEREERAWLAKIEKQARGKQAEKEYQEFLYRINQTIKTFKKQLGKSKKPKFSYPAWLAPYDAHEWCKLTLPTEERIEEWARPQIQEKVPSVLRDFVSCNLSSQMKTLPSAKYKLAGKAAVPSLIWYFLVLVLVKADLRVIEKSFSREFHGYEYTTKVEAEGLGSFYLGPALGGEREGFTTAIGLLSLLAKGEMEAPGIAVAGRGSPFTIFVVQGFEETVVVHDSFGNFIKHISEEKSLGEALLGKGLIDKDTARLVEEKAKSPLPQLVGAGEIIPDNSDIVAALQGLGYKKNEIQEAMEAANLSGAICLEEKIEAVLKYIGTQLHM